MQYEECSWGASPGRAVVVSSAMEMDERLAIQDFLTKAAELYGGKGNSSSSSFISPFSGNNNDDRSPNPGVVGDGFGRPGGENPFNSPFGRPGNVFGATTTTTTTERTFEEEMEEEAEFRIFESSPR